ncbi:MAG TPA: VWA domain-containing protein [Vicinamibacterales bacterium]|nr:VWA domain-containing protein [Vicinamibacterales bacterium]
MRTLLRLAAGILVVLFAASAPSAVPAERAASTGAADQSQAQPPPAQPPAQQEPERAQQPIRTGINFVRVDIIVTGRDGNPALDLKPEEFSIFEDGKPQKIETFSVVNIDAASQVDMPAPIEIRSAYDEEREAAREDVRLFLILLDDYHVRRGNDMVIREPLIEFIQNQLSPADMVAIMYPLTPVRDLTFTRNRRGLSSAIANFEGRRFNYEPRNEFEERYAYYPAAMVEKIRTDVTMSALRAAAVKLGGMREGRKSIIFVSEGFTGTLPPQLNDPVAAFPGLGNPARGRTDVGVSERAEFLNNTQMISDLTEVFREATRNNTSIYPVDPRGLAAFEYDINQGIGLQMDRRHLEASLDTLRALAENTDGRAIINRNDLAVGMKQIIRDSSGYYLIGYNSTEAPTDGKFHEIKVRVSRRGVDVRARKGYWAYTAEDAARATGPPKPDAPAAVTAALTAIAEPPRGRPARFWVGTSKADSGRTKVTFAWEPIPPAPGERRDPSDAPVRVMVTAMAPDGRPLFRGRIPEEDGSGGADRPPGADTVRRAAAASFEAPPGRVQMRMVVEGADGRVIDSAVREMTLPDFTGVELSFGTPVVFRARTPREIQTIRNSAEAVPTADRHFSRTDRLLIRTPAYAPGGAVPVVTARLLNRNGDSMADLPVQTSPGGAEIDYGLSSLAVGDYIIELTARTESGQAQELIAFKVGR